MAKVTNTEFDVEMQIKSIELLNSTLNLPANPKAPLINFNFNISVESRADAANKLVFVIVHVKINNDDQSMLLGALSLSCIFEIANFEDVVKVEPDGQLIIPQGLIHTLNSISISTTRGFMFSTFKGTLLHGAVLPIIDPRELGLGSNK